MSLMLDALLNFTNKKHGCPCAITLDKIKTFHSFLGNAKSAKEHIATHSDALIYLAMYMYVIPGHVHVPLDGHFFKTTSSYYAIYFINHWQL